MTLYGIGRAQALRIRLPFGVNAYSKTYVTGALAEATVGPFARNVVGARRADERIAAALDAALPSRSSGRTVERQLADD